MNASDFFSSNEYVYLPTRENPKVALAIDNAELAKNAFKLYNPFSSKAQLLKKMMEAAFVKVNVVAKKLLWREKKEKSDFISHMENKLNKPLVSSLYFATIKDKVVMQLQTIDAKIIGYVKYPLNEVGLGHIENEERAIELLSNRQIVEPYLLTDAFEGKPFLLLAPLEGEIGLVKRKYVDDLLLKFKREERYPLSSHPRIVALKKRVSSEMPKYLKTIDKICQKSNSEYTLVYEHGDFTPWNIVKVDNTYIPFDFEHFVEDGLEYFDLIKYYYQIGKLLKRKSGDEMIDYISEQIDVEEIQKLLQLFLVKEIIRSKEEGEPFEFEETLLKQWGNQ